MGYIADFYCPSLKMVIEVDGPTHDPSQDARRDKVLLHEGIVTLRFKADDVVDRLPFVLASIDHNIATRGVHDRKMVVA
jgi:very-short-patch-repair endonuclease